MADPPSRPSPPSPSASPSPSALVLIGGGGHALVVAEAAMLALATAPGYLGTPSRAPRPSARRIPRDSVPSASPLGTECPAPPRPIGFLDDDTAAPLASGEGRLPWLGPLLAFDRAAAGFIIAVGDLTIRRQIIEQLARHPSGYLVTPSGANVPLSPSRHGVPSTGTECRTPMEDAALSVIHPAAWIAPSSAIGCGTFIGPAAVIHTRAVVAQHSIINTGAIVEHDCHIGENVHIGPGAVVGGGVRIGSDTLVGLGSRVLPCLRIGRNCTIGAGAVVTRDVPDGRTVAGVPAR